MQILQADYFDAYRHLKLTRDDKGVLVAENASCDSAGQRMRANRILAEIEGSLAFLPDHAHLHLSCPPAKPRRRAGPHINSQVLT